MSKVPNVEIPFGLGAPGMIAQTREPIYVRDLGETDLIKQAYEPGVQDRFNKLSSIGYPLIYRDELLGVIAFDAANIREFSARERKIFSIISNHVAMAIYNAESHERLIYIEGALGKSKPSAPLQLTLITSALIKVVPLAFCGKGHRVNQGFLHGAFCQRP